MSLWEKVNNRSNSTLIVLGIGAIFLVIVLYSSFSRNPGAYESKLLKARENRDLYFKNSPDSPVPRDLKAEFEGLAYFKPNAAFISAATLERDPQPDTVRMLMSNGEAEQMLKFGKVTFRLFKKEYSLSAFRTVDAAAGTDLFIPFTDLSSGNQTYGGGRYLNIPMATPLTIDFNEAYHPDCLYNDGFACP
ncbi:MAG: DUF1684 domain-containing protein, partial [Bacteroidia bacterium]|nr:DUF1684 domain-containing protein [Bacteroidia bacterium]